MSVSQPLDPMALGTLVVERGYAFSASHRYYRPEWTPERNQAVFGKCANAPAHGHNYRLTVRVSGPVDSATGFAVDLAALDGSVRRAVLDRLDHAHINDALPEFAPGGAIPSTENLALWIAGALAAALPERSRLEEVRVAEDDRLASVWSRTGR